MTAADMPETNLDLPAAAPAAGGLADTLSRPFPALAVIRLAGYIANTLVLLPFQLAGLLALPGLARGIPVLHHRIGARILGLDIRCEGRLEDRPATLYVANHVSYYDIVALGAVLRARFVAKREVAGWPGFAQLAWLSRTVFIDRRARGARRQVGELNAALRNGERLIIFPEGTSSDGTRVLPFKSSLFAAVAGADVRIQPVSVRYTRLDGLPVFHADRPFCAWYGDMDLMPHLWRSLMRDRMEVAIRFHPPIDARDHPDRKTLARACREQIASDLGQRVADLTRKAPVLVWGDSRREQGRREPMSAEPAARATIGE